MLFRALLAQQQEQRRQADRMNERATTVSEHVFVPMHFTLRPWQRNNTTRIIAITTTQYTHDLVLELCGDFVQVLGVIVIVVMACSLLVCVKAIFITHTYN